MHSGCRNQQVIYTYIHSKVEGGWRKECPDILSRNLQGLHEVGHVILGTERQRLQIKTSRKYKVIAHSAPEELFSGLPAKRAH